MTTHPTDRAPRTNRLNLLPFASMAGGWLGPLLMFWLYVWGPLRPFDYPQEDLTPSWPAFTSMLALCAAVWWLPESYFRVHSLERSGRIYRALGVRLFRLVVPDGDLANRWHRRRHPGYRMIPSRSVATAFADRTRRSERGHLVLLAIGMASAAFAWRIGWVGWALYLGLGNIAVNLYPVLLQRYTRTRLLRLTARARAATS